MDTPLKNEGRQGNTKHDNCLKTTS